MYLKAVKYKDDYLAPGSRAYELYHDKKFKELDVHLREVERNYRKLCGETDERKAPVV